MSSVNSSLHFLVRTSNATSKPKKSLISNSFASLKKCDKCGHPELPVYQFWNNKLALTLPVILYLLDCPAIQEPCSATRVGPLTERSKFRIKKLQAGLCKIGFGRRKRKKSLRNCDTDDLFEIDDTLLLDLTIFD